MQIEDTYETEYSFTYPIELSYDTNGALRVSFPDIPEAHTYGTSLEEALANADEALVTALELYVAEWKPLPKPSFDEHDGLYTACPCPRARVGLTAYVSARQHGLTKAVFLRMLGVLPGAEIDLFACTPFGNPPDDVLDFLGMLPEKGATE